MPAQRGQRCLQTNRTMQTQWGQRGLCYKDANASALRAARPAWKGQQHQCNGANMPAQRGQQHRCNEGDKSHAMWGWRGQQDKDDNAGTTRATRPVQCWQWRQCNKGNDIIVTTAKTPAHQRLQQCHCDEGNDTSLITATMPLQHGQQGYCDNGKGAWNAKMPTHWQWQHHCNKGKDASSTTAKMPAVHRWQQQPHVMMATTPSQQWLC